MPSRDALDRDTATIANAPIQSATSRHERAPAPVPRWFWWGLAAIAIVGLGLRIAWVLYAAHTPKGLYDPARYFGSAKFIAQGKGYREYVTGFPSAYYPPGYPWFFGIVVWIAENNPIAREPIHLMGYVQAVLGTSTIGAVAIIGRRMRSAVTGLVAAAVVALYPNLIFHTAAMLSETLCIALLCGALAALWWRPRGVPLTRWQVWTFAVLFGLGVMVRPISLPVLVVVILLWWVELRHDWRRLLRYGGVAVGVLVVLIGSWTIRNAVRMHAFVPLSTNTGDNLCIGHGKHATGGFRLTDDCRVKHSPLEGPKGEVSHDAEARQLAWKATRKNLSREPWLTWRRLYYMFVGDHDGLSGVTSYRTDHWMPDHTFDAWARLGDDYGAVVLGLGIAGCLLLLADRDGRALVAITAIVVAVPLLFFGDPRFKVPAMPLLSVAAAITLTAPFGALATGLRRNRRRARRRARQHRSGRAN